MKPEDYFIQYLNNYFKTHRPIVVNCESLDNICVIDLKFTNRNLSEFVTPLNCEVCMVDFLNRTISFSFEFENLEKIKLRNEAISKITEQNNGN